MGEFLNIAMHPVARYTGELVDFTVGNGGAGLLLIGGDGNPDMVLTWEDERMIVIVQRRQLWFLTRSAQDEMQ